MTAVIDWNLGRCKLEIAKKLTRRVEKQFAAAPLIDVSDFVTSYL